MAISKFGYGAIAMALVGTIYNTVSMVMPMWTVSDTVNAGLTSQVTSSNFKAGIMGFCVDSELANASTALDHCFYYKFGSSYDDLAVLNKTIWAEYGSSGVCTAYSDAGDVSDATRLEYVTVLATAAGLNATQFDKFLDKSCGTVGFFTMTFSGMGMSNGLMAAIAMIGATTCKVGNKKWVGASYFFPGVSAFTALLTIILWMVQAAPLGEDDEVSLKMAFFLMIVAMLHYPLCAYLFWRHQNLSSEKNLDDDQTFVLEASDSQGGSRAYM